MWSISRVSIMKSKFYIFNPYISPECYVYIVKELLDIFMWRQITNILKENIIGEAIWSHIHYLSCQTALLLGFTVISSTSCIQPSLIYSSGFPGDSDGKEFTCNAGDPGSTPVSRGSSGEGNGYTLQYSCLENSMDRISWQVIVCGITESWTWLSN